MTMRDYRGCVAVAAALVLAGCGGGGESGSADGKAVALTLKQVRGTVPDVEAMRGWKTILRPVAVEMDDLYRSQACPIKGNAGCENSRFFGSSAFLDRETGAHVSFQIIAYDSEQSAREGYDALWDGYYNRRAGAKAKPFELGPVGDESDARLGIVGFKGEAGAVTQTRVGTTVLVTETAAGEKGGVDEDSARDLTAVIAERARQAQDGDTPSAALDD
ncbi:hypothetical protein [Streptomyces sp. NPDC003832]